ncbi:MAG: TonB-dependent receptor [Caulobacteraceae bacterium]
MSPVFKAVSPLALIAALFAYSNQAYAEEGAAEQPQAAPVNTSPAAPAETSGTALTEVVVTARRQAENIQQVPDAITAFTAQALVNAGIKNLTDLSQVTPDLNFRDGRGFAANFFDLRMRGIGQAQSGWPAVGFIVDGVPAASQDALTSTSLTDVERIEVLRGPQSALYGANAIAGAINIVTVRPTDDFHAQGRLFYGNGNDLQAGASVSGALIPDQLFARLAATYTNDDGRINSASNGIHLDPTYAKHLEGRLIWDPVSSFEADIHMTLDQEEVGYAFQDRVPSVAQINDYSSDYEARRNIPGRQERSNVNFAARLRWDAGPVVLTSVSSYTNAAQNGFGDACYDDVNSPGVFANPDGSVTCISNVVAYGDRAQPGQAIEAFQSSVDNYNTVFQDFRAASKPNSPIEWLFGVDGMVRNALDGFGTSQSIAGQSGLSPIFVRFDQRYDQWYGVYGQVGAHLGKWEFSFAGRYDDQTYKDTGYTSSAETTVIQATSPNGTLENSQTEHVTNFQPKGQISYHFDRDLMAYVTVSQGFRAGYFSSGSYGAPEQTTNYEGGVKSEWFQRRVMANLSVFHIDYSDQQLSTNLIEPPYRLPVTIPKTDINGVEFESAYKVSPVFTLTANLAYLDATASETNATVTAGTQSPKSPRWSGSVGGQLNQPLANGWTLNAHADASFHSSEYLYLNNTQEIPANVFVNARVGVEKGAIGIYFVGSNLTNTKEDEIQTSINPVYAARYLSEPASYGVELRVKY